MSQPETTGVEVAIFAAGCFWGVEETFRRVPGVLATRVGYIGGHADNPTYEAVCYSDTGHAEAVEVTYDSSAVPFQTLLDIFWQNHNPTTLNRQGPDIGTQYRSAIFVTNDAQRASARTSLASRQADEHYFPGRQIVTKIEPAATFWPAEDYHQQYLAKRGRAHCHVE